MVGAFGLLTDPHQKHFPADRIVENRARLDSYELVKAGTLVEGAVTEVKWGEKHSHLAMRTVDLLVDGNPIQIVWSKRGRRFFACPACDRRARHLYFPELRCRYCLRLEYGVQHLYRSTPELWKIRRLRRRIGASEQPFTPIARRQRHHLRYHRIVAKITELEGHLVNYLGSINRDLYRRMKSRKAKYQW
jgi:hypothetical protein